MYGRTPWNKGLTGTQGPNSGSFQRGHLTNERNINWRGHQVSYVGLHQWVRRKLGAPVQCEHCGSKEGLQWANVSQEYKRELGDWMPLCRFCHRKYDGQTGKEWADKLKKIYA